MARRSRPVVCLPLHSIDRFEFTREWREASDKLIKLWDSYSGEIIRTLEGHTEGISDIAWSHDGEYLASASDDKTIRIWSLDLVSTVIVVSLRRIYSIAADHS
jgi:WD40 repeat protein